MKLKNWSQSSTKVFFWPHALAEQLASLHFQSNISNSGLESWPGIPVYYRMYCFQKNFKPKPLLQTNTVRTIHTRCINVSVTHSFNYITSLVMSQYALFSNVRFWGLKRICSNCFRDMLLKNGPKSAEILWKLYLNSWNEQICRPEWGSKRSNTQECRKEERCKKERNSRMWTLQDQSLKRNRWWKFAFWGAN